MKSSRRTLLVTLALVIGTALLFWPVATFDSVTLDDQIYLLNNYHLSAGFTWANLRWCFTTTYASMWHPLTWLSYLLDYQIYHHWLGGYHLTNLLLHIVSSVLLFRLLLRMTNAFWRSTLVAALFAWHPLHVESVAWLSERKDALCAVFWMLAWWSYIRYAEACQKVEKPARQKFYALTLAFFILGSMAKPMLVTLPFVFLLLDWWPLRRMQSDKSGSINPRALVGLFREKIPFFILSLIFSILAAHAAAPDTLSLQNLPFLHRAANAVIGYFFYVSKIIWPARLTAIYAYDALWKNWQVSGAVLFLVTMSGVAFHFRNSRPYLLFGWLWFLGTLVPVIGLVRVGAQSLADHYTYLSAIGLFIAACWGASDLVRATPKNFALLGTAACAVLVACVLVTSRQLQYWRNGETLLAHNLDVDPDNFFARTCYAAFFLDRGQWERARRECEKSLALAPNYELSHSVLAEVLLDEGKFAQAADESAIGLELNPASSYARLFHARALLGQNRLSEAEQEFNTVLAQGTPMPQQVHFSLGQIFAKLGQPNAAAAQFAEALRLTPDFADARLQLALVLARMGKPDEAIAQYRQAEKAPPSVSDAIVKNNLAWTLATSAAPELRSGVEAVNLARSACEQDQYQQPMFIGTLAAAYAEAGQYEDAVAAARKAYDLALTLAERAPDPATQKTARQIAARNQQLLEIYQSHQPYHEK